MDSLATALRGLPLCVEHQDDKPVGSVAHAWVAPDRRLYALFETTGDSFGGFLAGRLVEHALTTELSLGHTCTIASSDTSMAVVAKKPTEISLCVKGARTGTRIVGRTSTPHYIRVMASASARATMADAPSQSEPTNAGTIAPTSSDMMTQLLEQVKQLSESHALAAAQNTELQAKFDEASQKVEVAEMAGKRKREQAVDGTIKGTHPPTLRSPAPAQPTTLRCESPAQISSTTSWPSTRASSSPTRPSWATSSSR